MALSSGIYVTKEFKIGEWRLDKKKDLQIGECYPDSWKQIKDSKFIQKDSFVKISVNCTKASLWITHTPKTLQQNSVDNVLPFNFFLPLSLVDNIWEGEHKSCNSVRYLWSVVWKSLKSVNVVLVFLLLTLSIFYTLFLVFILFTLNK